MTAYTRERSDADWYRGLKIPAVVIRNIDEKTEKAVTGRGGVWAPSSPIIIGGEGIELQCAMLLSGATVAPAAGKAIRFGDDDYFVHGTPQTRTIDQSPWELLATERRPRVAVPICDTTIAVVPFLRTVRAGALLRLLLRIPDNSIVTSLAIDFIVGQAHANVPTHLPKARLVRIAADGTITPYPSPTSSIVDNDGWVEPALPGSGAAWYAAGAVQTLTLSYSITGAVTDTDTYAYALEWKEENGTNAFTDYIGNILQHVRFTVTQSELSPY